jgi:predicted SprT family Zn-dependent metalloprotease
MKIVDDPVIGRQEAIEIITSVIDSKYNELFSKFPEQVHLFKEKPKFVLEFWYGRCAGKAYDDGNYIKLNECYLYSKDAETFVRETTLHEICHIFAKWIYNAHGHDKKWKEIYISLGGNGKRCHNYCDPPMFNDYYYVCDCKCAEISYWKHANQVEENKRCKKCGKEYRRISFRDYTHLDTSSLRHVKNL